MEIGNYKAFGVDISNYNPHWMKVYGQMLILISEIDMKDTIHLIDCSNGEDYEDIDKVDKIFQANGICFEGYTLRETSKWFIQYCKDWHTKNKEVQVQAKKDKINKLKEELKSLEDEMEN